MRLKKKLQFKIRTSYTNHQIELWINHVRNLKQVQNARYQFNKKKRLCWDEIYNIHVYNIEFNCISKLETTPSLSIVIYDKQLVEQINEYIIQSKSKVMISYDTTFLMCGYYVSPIICRHTFFEDEPPIPFSYFIYETKVEESHDYFFREIKKVGFLKIIFWKNIQNLVLFRSYLYLKLNVSLKPIKS